ncbi:MAG: Transcriptional regulator [Solirubrobacterales bacterium]|nr:Transcriptional regulator [Solirubrobacterales bacterium]
MTVPNCRTQCQYTVFVSGATVARGRAGGAGDRSSRFTDVPSSTDRPTLSPRRTAIADAAIALVAECGVRGLTHRAVDRRLGLPEGSTSSYHRTRRALLEVAMTRMVERSLEASAVADIDPTSPREAVAALAAVVERMSAPAGRELMVAHFELGLEARRDPELREVFVGLRAVFIGHAVRLVEAAGGADPERSGRALALFVNGLVLERLWHGEALIAPADVPAELLRFFEEPPA